MDIGTGTGPEGLVGRGLPKERLLPGPRTRSDLTVEGLPSADRRPRRVRPPRRARTSDRVRGTGTERGVHDPRANPRALGAHPGQVSPVTRSEDVRIVYVGAYVQGLGRAPGGALFGYSALGRSRQTGLSTGPRPWGRGADGARGPGRSRRGPAPPRPPPSGEGPPPGPRPAPPPDRPGPPPRPARRAPTGREGARGAISERHDGPSRGRGGERGSRPAATDTWLQPRPTWRRRRAGGRTGGGGGRGQSGC